MNTETKQLEDIKPFQAREIIEHLRKGSVPVEYVQFFSVGRENWLKFIAEDLQNYIAEGGSKVRFINGDYGDGKTHFMSLVSRMAREHRMAVSFVVLSREVPMNRLDLVYAEIVRQIKGQFNGSGIRSLLNDWADGQKEAIDNDDNGLNNISGSIARLEDMDSSFQSGLVSFLTLKTTDLTDNESDDDRRSALENLYQWFEGQKVAKRDLRPFKILEPVNKANIKRILASLISFLKYLDYGGFVVLLDEFEVALAQPTSVRNAAYENLRLLIDNAEQSKSIHFFFSIIPDVLQVEKGFTSYDALWSRVRDVGGQDVLNYRSPIIGLNRTPLKREELQFLGQRLVDIHKIAYHWELVDNLREQIPSLVYQTQEKMGLLKEVRMFIKQVINLLDAAEQGKEITAEEVDRNFLGAQKQIEQEKEDQMTHVWDT